MKTAGTSVEFALFDLCSDEDVLTPLAKADEEKRKRLGYPGPVNTLVPTKHYTTKDWGKLVLTGNRKRFKEHMSAYEVKQSISEDIWNSYFKFCFERNPFEKVLSFYYWRRGPQRWPTIMDFIESGQAANLRSFDMYTFNGLPIVDKVYKFENLKEALADIAENIHLSSALTLPNQKFKGAVRKDRKPAEEVMTNEELRTLSIMFAREIKMFGYPSY